MYFRKRIKIIEKFTISDVKLANTDSAMPTRS